MIQRIDFGPRSPMEWILDRHQTVSDGMNTDRSRISKSLGDDIVLIQPKDWIARRSFHYSIYPFDQWKQMTMNFDFIDVLLIPHQQRGIFQVVRLQRLMVQSLDVFS